MADSVAQSVEAFKRGLLDSLLAKCLPNQVELFNKIYPDGVKEEKLDQALDLLQRTVDKNERLGRT